MFNTDILNNFTMQAAVIIPIITAVVQAFKFWISDKYAPFIAMLVGIGVTFLMTHNALEDLSGTVLLGLLFGLASSGLYSGLQHTTQIIKMERKQREEKAEHRKNNK